MGMGSAKGSSRGKPYGMLLLLAFGAAVFGVMVLHKLRERRIFNLLIDTKDRDLLTLQLLLQKERDSTKEVKRKLEELKAKTYSLRIQKTELSNRLMNMQSVTTSLKEEQRALESALEEKQNEIKMLKEKDQDSNKEDSQIKALTELLKQKEAEIEDLKHHLESPVNIWSVSTDDPSNPPVNLTTTRGVTGKDKNEVGESKKEGLISEDRQLQGSTNPKDSETSTRRRGEGSRNGMEGTNQREIAREVQFQEVESSRDTEGFREKGNTSEESTDESQEKMEVIGNGKLEMPKNSQNGRGFRASAQKNDRNEYENSIDSKVSRTIDEGGDTKAMDGKEYGVTRDGQLEKLENSQDGVSQELGMIYKGGMKLEMLDGSHKGVGSKVRGGHGYMRKTKGKGRRITSRDAELEKAGKFENGEVMSIGGRTFYKDTSERIHRVALRDGELDKIENKMGLRMRDEPGERDAAIGHEQGGRKLEMPENSKSGEGLRMSTNSDNQVLLEGKGEGAVINEGRLQMPEKFEDGEGLRVKGEKVEESPFELRKEVVPSDAEDLRINVVLNDLNQQVGKDQEIVSKDGQLGLSQDSQDGKVLNTRSVNDDTTVSAANAATQQNQDETVQQPRDQETIVVQNLIDKRSTDNNRIKEAKSAQGDEETEDLDVADIGKQLNRTEANSEHEEVEF